MTTSIAIDWKMCIEKAMYKEDLAYEMLQKIVESLPQERSNCESALGDKDYAALQHHVHKLNGVCLYSGLPAIHSTGKALEHALRQDDLAPIPVLFDAFKAAISDVINAYESNQYKSFEA